MENVGRTSNTLYGTIHGPGYSGGSAVGGTRNLSAPLGDAFHNYAVDWSPNLIVWTVDGSEYFRATPAGTRGNPWVCNHAFFARAREHSAQPWPDPSFTSDRTAGSP